MTEEEQKTPVEQVSDAAEAEAWSPETPEAGRQEQPAETTPVAGGTAEAADAQPTGPGSEAQEAVSGDSGETEQLRERVAELERQLAEEREHATEYMRRLQRAQADFSNYKRRAEGEQEQRELLATARALSVVLPALDSFERAFVALPPSLRSFSWISGVALVDLQLRDALRVHGIEPVSAEPGQRFDPQRHESVGEIESAEHPEGHIAVVLQQGYSARGVLLRPALVQLARKPETASSATSTAEAHGNAAETADEAEV